MKIIIRIILVINFLLFFGSCSDVDRKTESLLGTWEVIKMDTGRDLTENAIKIEFFKGTNQTVNKFYLYTINGGKYEGQWQFYESAAFFMKFHEGADGVEHEDHIDGNDYNILEDQFTFSGTFRHYLGSDKYDEERCIIVLKRL